jgi:hypothetical protein
VLHVVEQRDGSVEIVRHLGRARDVKVYDTQRGLVGLVACLPSCRTTASHQGSYTKSQAP